MVNTKALQYPVYTISFPGPSVYAKQVCHVEPLQLVAHLITAVNECTALASIGYAALCVTRTHITMLLDELCTHP